uniref:hypothetical protein n=1 Tax=Escherichia coli TaxID=562 RepID=UPI0005CC9399
ASTLNAGQGDITLKAWNPNINLSAPAYNNTVRNAGSMLQVSGGSQLSGNNILLETTLAGANAVGLPVFINGATLTALQDITLKGIASDGAAPVQIELRGAGNTLNALNGNISITNSVNGVSAGIFLNGNASGDVNLNAVNGTINLSGTSGSGAGVQLTNAQLNASRAVIHGVSNSGNGFVLSGTTLLGSLADLANVTFSSAGSGAGATNILDHHVVNDSNRDNLLNMTIDNLTSVDMNGTSVFSNGSATWEGSYAGDANPNGGWIFNNTTVNASSVNLSGVGFSNATLTVTDNLNITNKGAGVITDSTVN